MSHVSLFCVCTIHGTVSQDAQYYCDKKFMALKGFFFFFCIYMAVEPLCLNLIFIVHAFMHILELFSIV